MRTAEAFNYAFVYGIFPTDPAAIAGWTAAEAAKISGAAAGGFSKALGGSPGNSRPRKRRRQSEARRPDLCPRVITGAYGSTYPRIRPRRSAPPEA
jgi:hypothetical protein